MSFTDFDDERKDLEDICLKNIYNYNYNNNYNNDYNLYLLFVS